MPAKYRNIAHLNLSVVDSFIEVVAIYWLSMSRLLEVQTRYFQLFQWESQPNLSSFVQCHQVELLRPPKHIFRDLWIWFRGMREREKMLIGRMKFLSLSDLKLNFCFTCQSTPSCSSQQARNEDSQRNIQTVRNVWQEEVNRDENHQRRDLMRAWWVVEHWFYWWVGCLKPKSGCCVIFVVFTEKLNRRQGGIVPERSTVRNQIHHKTCKSCADSSHQNCLNNSQPFAFNETFSKTIEFYVHWNPKSAT